jgi:hypothetical protein
LRLLLVMAGAYVAPQTICAHGTNFPPHASPIICYPAAGQPQDSERVSSTSPRQRVRAPAAGLDQEALTVKTGLMIVLFAVVSVASGPGAATSFPGQPGPVDHLQTPVRQSWNRRSEQAFGVRHAGIGLRVGLRPFQCCHNVSLIGECSLFGWGQFVVGVGGDGHG